MMPARLLFAFAISVVSLTTLTHASAQTYSDRVVAVVNGDVILESDIQRYKNPFIRSMTNVNLGVVPPGKWPTERELLEELIVIQLLDQEAAKKGMKLDERAVESSIDSLKKRNNLTQDHFLMYLATNGLNYADFRDLYKRQLRLKGLISQEVATKVPISERDAQSYFKDNKSQVETQYKQLLEPAAAQPPQPERFEPNVPTHEERYMDGEVRLRMITLKIPSSGGKKAAEQAKKKAEKIAQELMSGASFADMAKKNSEDPLAGKGGDLGYMKAKDMVPQLQQVVQRLKVGQVLGPIDSKEAIVFFYLDEAKNRKTTKVAIPENIRKRIAEEQRKQFESRVAQAKPKREPQEPPKDETRTDEEPTSGPTESGSGKNQTTGILTPEEEKEYKKVRDKVFMVVRTAKMTERMKEWVEEIKKGSIIDIKM